MAILIRQIWTQNLQHSYHIPTRISDALFPLLTWIKQLTNKHCFHSISWAKVWLPALCNCHTVVTTLSSELPRYVCPRAVSASFKSSSAVSVNFLPCTEHRSSASCRKCSSFTSAGGILKQTLSMRPLTISREMTSWPLPPCSSGMSKEWEMVNLGVEP